MAWSCLGKRQIHFWRESDGPRKKVLDAASDISPRCTIYDGSARPRRAQRQTCLLALVTDLAALGTPILVLERDDSVLELDRRLLYRSVRELGCPEMQYKHMRAHEEPLLAIPDAVAWCWQRGGR